MSLILATTMYAMTFFVICMRASRNLHNTMFHKLLKVEPRFFDVNPRGRILNRFSKDVGSIDEALPVTLFDTMRLLWHTFGVFLLVIYVSPFVGIATICLVACFCFFRRFYLKTSRHSLKF